MKAPKVHVNSDSQIVVNKINGSYEVREPQLKQYLQRVRTLIKAFQHVVVHHIPRSQNKRADALSKFASSSLSHLSQKVLVEAVGALISNRSQ